jgi:putative membrane protein
MDLATIIKPMVTALVFTTLGLVMFAIVFKIIQMVTPFSIRKEIEEDQNIALGILIGAIMLGLAIIIAAAIHG